MKTIKSKLPFNYKTIRATQSRGASGTLVCKLSGLHVPKKREKRSSRKSGHKIMGDIGDVLNY
jgi:hypothetical protein